MAAIARESPALRLPERGWLQASKGSLEVGKVADLVVRDQNPLKVDPMKIKDVKVVETIKEGRTIYRKDG